MKFELIFLINPRPSSNKAENVIFEYLLRCGLHIKHNPCQFIDKSVLIHLKCFLHVPFLNYSSSSRSAE